MQDIGSAGTGRTMPDDLANRKSEAAYQPSFVVRALPIALVCLLVALVYLPICAFPFSLIDDKTNVFRNKYLCQPDAQNIGYFWTHIYYDLYMPVTYTLWALCARIAPSPVPVILKFGGPTRLNPHVFHVLSLLLHVLNTALVYAVLRKLRFTRLPSAAGALVFGMDPLQVESVAWITGANNLTGGLFALLSLYLYLTAADADAAAPPNRSRHAIFAAMATVAFIAGLLSKPTSAVVPFFIIIIELLVLRRLARRWAPLMCLWTGIAAALLIVVQLNDRESLSVIWSPLWGRPFVAADSLAFYIAKVVLPVRLTFDYARRPEIVLRSWWGYATWGLPVALGWTLARTRYVASGLWFRVASLIFVTGLLPTLGIVTHYSQLNSTAADRYLYLPLLGLAIAVAAVATRLLARRTVLLTAVSAIVIVFLIVQTRQQIEVWRSPYSLTASMLARSPQSTLAHMNDAFVLVGDDDLSGGLAEFRKLDSLQRRLPMAQTKLYIGTTLIEMNRQAEAVEPLTEGFNINPKDSEIWYQLWNILAYLNRYKEAESVVRRHLLVSPSDSDAQLALAKLLLQRHDPQEALPLLEQCEREMPKTGAIPYFIGTAYEQLGRASEAIKYYESAAGIDPGNTLVAAAIERLQKHGQGSNSMSSGVLSRRRRLRETIRPQSEIKFVH